MDQLTRDSEFPADLSPLAWVQEELRRSLETVHKTLRRMLRDGDTRMSNFAGGEIGPSGPLQAAAAQLHQVAGVLSLVGLPAGSTLLRAAETAVAYLAERPASVDLDAVEIIERADFALLSFIARLLAGNRTSTLALFPAYRELQTFNNADRVHPADLWQVEWRWLALPADATARAVPASTVRAPFEATLLKAMREQNPAAQTAHAAAMSELCAALAAGIPPEQPHSRTLWQLAGRRVSRRRRPSCWRRMPSSSAWARACCRNCARWARATRACPRDWPRTCCSSARKPARWRQGKRRRGCSPCCGPTS